MKHNWTRPIVKFIEDDIVASGIGGVTGPARFFAARGAGLVGDGVNKTWGSGDTRTWSAWDNMFVQKSGQYGQKRRRFTPTRGKRGVRLYRRKYIRRRPRMMRRSRATWGTRVRRAALRSNESKRHQVTTITEAIDDQVLDTTAIARVPDLNQGAGGIEGMSSKISRNGATIITTGIASWIHIRNTSTVQAMRVDLIWFYKKRDVAAVQAIFKDNQFEAINSPSDPTSYFARMIMPYGNLNTVILKKLTIDLAEAGETAGTESRMLKVWLPFKKVMKFNYTSEGTTNQDYDIHFGIRCHNKEGQAFSTTTNVLIAQHRHVLYFRDP